MTVMRSLAVTRVATWLPLIGYVVPTLGIGFGVVIPGSCVEGVNSHTVGFLAAVLGFIPAYMTGIVIARRQTGAK